MIALQKLWKLFFISSKKLFSFSRSSNYCIPVFPLFLPVSHCVKNITHCVWYLGKEKRYGIETFLWQNHAENVHQKLVPESFSILVNNPKQPLHARSSFENNIFWKSIIKNLLKSHLYFFFQTQSLSMYKPIKI